MNLTDLRQLLLDIKRVRVGVMGDMCLDAYWFVDPSAAETSLETGLVTRPVASARYAPGGGSNIAANLVTLGAARVCGFGVVGDDPFGGHLLRLLEAAGIATDGIHVQAEGWGTHVFIKPHLNARETERIDFGNFNVLAEATRALLLEGLERALPGLDAVVINQQTYRGIHASASFRTGLQELIQRHTATAFLLDSRHYSDAYAGTARKLNEREALTLANIATVRDEEAEEAVHRAASYLHGRWRMPLCITRGARGCLVVSGADRRQIAGLSPRGPIDPVGAGDTMSAAIAAALAAGRDMVVAAELGNLAAAATVTKLFQTGTASPEEILDLAGAGGA